MNVTCSDRERIFEDGTPVEWAALEAHAASCPLCAEEVRAWKSLSVAAEELRDYSDSPLLWPRISLGWQTALAGAFVVLLAISGGWIYIDHPVAPVDNDKSLLRSSALKQ